MGEIVNTVKSILDQTSNANHSRPITINTLSRYSALKLDYIEQICQVANAIRDDAWGHMDIMALRNRADDVLEAVMLKGTELSRLMDSYIGREFSVLNRLRAGR